MEETVNKALTKDELIKENEALKQKLREVYAEAQKRIHEMDYANALARLNVLFEVLKNEHLYPEDFIKDVVNEIVDTITIKNKETEE